MTSESPAAKRLVPGAPPPPTSKSQKKKRRGPKKDGAEDSAPQTPAGVSVGLPDAHAAALTDHAPSEKDLNQGLVADELIAKQESKREVTTPLPDSEETRPSPISEIFNKRLKALGKKITRIQTYSDKPASELNEDQKKTLLTLPTLEAIRKELEETKKAVEVQEVEQAKEAAHERAEAENAERQRIEEVIAEAQREHVARTAKLLDIIRLQSLFLNADPSIQALNVAEAELNAIYAFVNVLLAQEAASRLDIMHGFLQNEGDIEGIPFSRLLEILDAHTNQPSQEEIALEAEAAEAVLEALAENAQEAVQVNAGGVPAASGAPSFQFMQESELESDPALAGNDAEWVDQEPPSNIVVSVVTERETYISEPGEPIENNNALNWADDEGDLPPIDGLHASFGTPTTPAEHHHPKAPETQYTEAPERPPVNGFARPHADEEDGFQQARGGRERGRGRGRGGFRGGERGGYRGDRGERGGFRGGRGGRGRPHQGGEGGPSNWRGGPDGEHRDRGRGRGRGRGGFDRERGPRGGRGGNNHPEAQAAPPNA